jgi:hypothetical protein
LLGSGSLLLGGSGLLLGHGSLLLGSGSLLLGRGGLLLGLGHLGLIHSVDFGSCHDGSAAPDAEDRVRVGHQLHVRKPHIGEEHHGKGGGDYCNLEHRLHLLPPVGVSGMKSIRFAPWGGAKAKRASATPGATFQSLMTVLKFSKAGVLVSVTTYLRGSGCPLSATHTWKSTPGRLKSALSHLTPPMTDLPTTPAKVTSCISSGKAFR